MSCIKDKIYPWSDWLDQLERIRLKIVAIIQEEKLDLNKLFPREKQLGVTQTEFGWNTAIMFKEAEFMLSEQCVFNRLEDLEMTRVIWARNLIVETSAY